MAIRPRSLLPRSLQGRALLILIVPIVTIQLVVSIAFIQRHFERVTQQMTGSVATELQLVLAEMDQGHQDLAARIAGGLDIRLSRPATPMAGVTREFSDLSGRVVAQTLADRVPGFLGADMQGQNGRVIADFRRAEGVVRADFDRKRMSASNPHQLLVLMLVTSALMTLIAFLFLRNQMVPITRLAVAAEAFGRGQHLPYKPRGAIEVRAAGAAFLDMRARIERAMESRTRMLSGVSHDLRTPLTRLKLGLSMLPDDEETQALLGDVADMERLVDEFLAFARGDATEDPSQTDVAALLQRVVDNADRGRGPRGAVELVTPGQVSAVVRPAAVTRAVENLLGNALRYGTRARITLSVGDRHLRITVEDDGPGIPQDQRDEAMQPFARLDGARDPNRGGGVGLGLSIASDLARSHGGTLRLGESADLGGLKAELVLAR